MPGIIPLNPSFEVPSLGEGQALNWAYESSSTFKEYAAFDAPLIVPVGFIIIAAPPNLGFSVVQGGSPPFIIILIVADTFDSFEDFDDQWQSNEDSIFAYGAANGELTAALFGPLKPKENFEDGWKNDGGLLTNFNVLAKEIAAFDLVPELFEDFAEGWPFGADGIHINEFLRIAFGRFIAPATFVDGSALTAPEYANDISLFALAVPVDVEIQISGIDKSGGGVSPSVTFTLGQLNQRESISPEFGTGLRDVTNVTPNGPSTGTVRIDGDPGPQLVRAFFN